MKLFITCFLFNFILLSCQNNQSKVIVNKDFEKLILGYMHKHNKIPNSCDAKPFYGIEFIREHNDTLIMLSAALGESGCIIPTYPDSLPPVNPIEKKGATIIGDNLVVIYDFKNSNGYGLYNPLEVDKDMLSKFRSLPDSCVNVIYPGAVIYKLHHKKLILKKELHSFKLK